MFAAQEVDKDRRRSGGKTKENNKWGRKEETKTKWEKAEIKVEEEEEESPLCPIFTLIFYP